MLLIHPDNFFDMRLVVMNKVSESILKPSDVVRCFYELVKATMVCLVPKLLLTWLEEQVNEGIPYASLENAGEIIL
jgi:hypothetical protein